MPTTLKSVVLANVPAADTLLYTVPGATQAVIMALHIANKTAAQVTFNVTALDNSAGTTVTIVQGAGIPPGSSAVPISSENRMVLEAGDTIRIQAGAAASLDAHLSISEFS